MKLLQKTRKGATSMIVIIFFTLLAGILVLSFVSIMVMNISESTNFNLSQSAYDSALAGIEDAKVMLLEYNACTARGDTTSSQCKKVVEEVSRSDSNDDCDLVRKALNRASGDNETLIRSDNTSINNGADSNLDMAYTCVKVALDVEDYLGTIKEDSDMKVIPLRTHVVNKDEVETSGANTIKLQWYSSSDYEELQNVYGADPFTTFSEIRNYSKKFATNKIKTIDNAHNQFYKTASVPPVINVGLIQTNTNFYLEDLYTNNNNRSDRGRLTLRPILSTETDPAKNFAKIDNIVNGGSNDVGFAASVVSGITIPKNSSNGTYYGNNYTVNSPIDTKCMKPNNIQNSTYACTAYIRLPDPYRGGGASDVTRFLTLSAPYSSPDISFSVTMLSCNNSFWTGADDAKCETVDFVGVQSKVDATGRANDVFRRIDARVELVDTGFPFPKYSIGLYGDDSVLHKDYEVTRNCWNIDNGSVKTCYNMQPVSNPGFVD